MRFIAINATALKIAVNGSILAKPAVLSAPVDQGACWRCAQLDPTEFQSAAVPVTGTPRGTAVASWMRFSVAARSGRHEWEQRRLSMAIFFVYYFLRKDC